MASRKIEAEVQVSVDGTREVDQLEDQIEDLTDRPQEVEVDADTRQAQSNIERFADEIDGLTREGVELRIEFREQVLRQQIRNTLRQLERLEDPVEIDVKQQELDQLQTDLRDLAQLADRKYEIEVDADPRRTARRAADDIDGIRQRGEGLQSAVPALRGFTDELGGTAANAGIASQAVADLGDFSLIMGEKMGLSEVATTKLGTALSFLGLGGVIVGGVLAGFQAISSAGDQVAEETDGAVDALTDLLDISDKLKEATEDTNLVAALIGDEDPAELGRIGAALGTLGLEGDQLASTLRRVEGDAEAFFTTMLDNTGLLSRQGAEDIANVIASTDDWGAALQQVVTRFPELASVVQNELRPTIEALETLNDTSDDIDLDEAVERIAGQLLLAGEISAEFFQALTDGTIDGAEALEILEDKFADTEDAIGGNKTALDNMIPSFRGVETAGSSTFLAIGEDVDGVSEKYKTFIGDLNQREAYLRLQGQFDDVREKGEEAFEAAQTGADDAEEKARDYELALIDLKTGVANYATEWGEVPDEVAVDVVVNAADVDDLETRLDRIDRGVYSPSIQPTVDWSRVPSNIRAIETGRVTNRVTVNVNTQTTGAQLTRTLDTWARVNG